MNFPPPTPRQARLIWFALSAVALAVLLGLAGVAVWGLGRALEKLSGVLLPMAFALILAYILDPLVTSLVRRRVPRPGAICLVFGLGLLVLGGVLGTVVPDIIKETRELVTTLPGNAERLRRQVQHYLEHSSLAQQVPGLFRHDAAGHTLEAPPPAANLTNALDTRLTLTETDHPAKGVLAAPGATAAGPPSGTAPGAEMETLNHMLNTPLSDTVLSRMEEVLKLLLRWVGSQLGKVTVWAEFLAGLVLVPVYLFYFLLEKDGIVRAWTDYLPIHESRIKEELVFVLQAINDCLIAFFRGQILVSISVGILLAIGYLALGLNYAVLIGLVAATAGIIPYLGAAISLVFALSVAAVQFGDWHHPLLVMLVAGLVKLAEDFFISPKIMGERSGLHPLTIIVAVMVGTTVLGGILGAILAIPLTAVLRTLMFRYVWRGRAGEAEMAPPGH